MTAGHYFDIKLTSAVASGGASQTFCGSLHLLTFEQLAGIQVDCLLAAQQNLIQWPLCIVNQG